MPKELIMESVGPYAWGILHHAVESLPCSTCSEAGTKMIQGLHDMVNVHLGKPVKQPESLKWLSKAAQGAAHKAGLNPGSLEWCVQAVKRKSCPEGVRQTDLSLCKANPYAVCQGRLRSHD